MEHQWRPVGEDEKARVKVEQCDRCDAIRRVKRNGVHQYVRLGKKGFCATAP